LLVVSVAAALAGGIALAPQTAHAAQAQQVVAKQSAAVGAVANALIQFEAASRWEAMAPTWRSRRDPWLARVRAAQSPAQLGALTLELETIMTWAAMYPRWRQQRAGWVASAQAVASEHDAAQVLIALEAATTWNAMFENRWRPARTAWLAGLQSI
jgi:hypothetical protein